MYYLEKWRTHSTHSSFVGLSLFTEPRAFHQHICISRRKKRKKKEKAEIMSEWGRSRATFSKGTRHCTTLATTTCTLMQSRSFTPGKKGDTTHSLYTLLPTSLFTWPYIILYIFHLLSHSQSWHSQTFTFSLTIIRVFVFVVTIWAWTKSIWVEKLINVFVLYVCMYARSLTLQCGHLLLSSSCTSPHPHFSFRSSVLIFSFPPIPVSTPTVHSVLTFSIASLHSHPLSSTISILLYSLLSSSCSTSPLTFKQWALNFSSMPSPSEYTKTDL